MCLTFDDLGQLAPSFILPDKFVNAVVPYYMRVIRSRASLQYKTLVQIFPIRITGVFQYIAATQLRGSVIVIFLH